MTKDCTEKESKCLQKPEKENINSTSNRSQDKNNSVPLKKRKTIQTDDRIIEMISDMEKTIQAKSDEIKKDIEWNFCMSLYASFKKMDKHRRKNLRFRISQLLHEAESSDSS